MSDEDVAQWLDSGNADIRGGSQDLCIFFLDFMPVPVYVYMYLTLFRYQI